MGEPQSERKTPESGAVPWSPVPQPDVPSRRTEWVAGGLTVLWLALVGAVWLFLPAGEAAGPNAASLVMTVVGVVLPVVMIWIAAVTARTAQEMRAEAQALKVALEAMRSAWLNQTQIRGGQALEKKLDEVAIAARQAGIGAGDVFDPARPWGGRSPGRPQGGFGGAESRGPGR
ncbi:hypothetical protein ACTTAM_16690 [Rhodobacter capsulatus]|uniref:hypothetical protein n=1 Tax=Rhodobacter capsulatus TaxID=1061 RepID=UPI00402865F7